MYDIQKLSLYANLETHIRVSRPARKAYQRQEAGVEGSDFAQLFSSRLPGLEAVFLENFYVTIGSVI